MLLIDNYNEILYSVTQCRRYHIFVLIKSKDLGYDAILSPFQRLRLKEVSNSQFRAHL